MNFLRPNVVGLSAYTPGEQPKVPGLIKLNTNENPYPPSPRVVEALEKAIRSERLRLYPDPVSTAMRQCVANLFGLNADQVLVGNGSDEILTLAVRAIVGEGHDQEISYFWPSYSLYPVLANIQGAAKLELPLNESFEVLESELPRLAKSRLVFITNPNAPTGRLIPKRKLESIIQHANGVVLLDEAYVDFADENGLEFIHRYPNVLISRTLSKSYSLAGLRVGFAMGSRELIEGLDKVRDSYNVNYLSQVAGLAALEDQAYLKETVSKIRSTRDRFSRALMDLGFEVIPSAANFIFAKPPAVRTASEYFGYLRSRNILVRYFDAQPTRNYVRITVGRDDEMDRVIEETRAYLKFS